MTASSFTAVAEVLGDVGRATIYEHGWQSWSPVGRYPATATSPRPARPEWQTMAFRPGSPPPDTGFQGEGLLAVIDGEGRVRVWVAPDPHLQVASIRATAAADRIVVAANGPVAELEARDDDLQTVLARYADGLAKSVGVSVPSLPAAWCSWYCYGGDVCSDDVLTNLTLMDRLGLEVGTVQIDDGHQREIGDWLVRSPRFGPLGELADRITDAGRAAGVWTAPFLVGVNSTLAERHPDWLVGGAVAAPHQWHQQVGVLDVTHPDAAEHLRDVFRTLRGDGFTYHKIDFLYGGAMEGRRHADCTGLDAYAEGLRLIREGAGDDATILGCGAPLLPSVGRVDAMRVGPDIAPSFEPVAGDISQPSQRAALAASRNRAWMHARLWVNDPDCLIARPAMEQRDTWASFLAEYGGLAVSSDPLGLLDEHGLELTRRILRPSGTTPLDWPIDVVAP